MHRTPDTGHRVLGGDTRHGGGGDRWSDRVGSGFETDLGHDHRTGGRGENVGGEGSPGFRDKRLGPDGPDNRECLDLGDPPTTPPRDRVGRRDRRVGYDERGHP